MKLHLTATGCHLTLWDHTVLPAIRHKWIHPDLTPVTGRLRNDLYRVAWGVKLLNPTQSDRPVLDLPTPEGWKAELT